MFRIIKPTFFVFTIYVLLIKKFTKRTTLPVVFLQLASFQVLYALKILFFWYSCWAKNMHHHGVCFNFQESVSDICMSPSILHFSSLLGKAFLWALHCWRYKNNEILNFYQLFIIRKISKELCFFFAHGYELMMQNKNCLFLSISI